jgi:hypothetical protein
MSDIVSARCLDQFDPPKVEITLAGQIPFQVDWGIYDLLNREFGFPPLICGTYRTGDDV